MSPPERLTDRSSTTAGDAPSGAAPESSDAPRVEEMSRREPAGAPSLLQNVTANIGGELVYVLSGFVLPRLIFDRIGVEMLGIWDFGWSMVAHIMLVGGGMMSAVSRDVARFTATRDVSELRRLISSCFVMFSLCGGFALLLAIVVAGQLPVFLPDLSAAHYIEARAVVVLLGMTVAVRFPFHVFNGIITGHQRYVLHNLIVSGTYLGSAAAMIVLVASGYGLIAMAAAYLAGEAAGAILKLYFSRRVCPDWRIEIRSIRRSTMAYVVTFGGKTLLGSVSQVLLYQSNAMLVGHYLGVEALAVFSRSRSLVLAADRILIKVGMVFAPRSSFLDARGDREALQKLLRSSVEYSLYLALPAVLLLTIMGGPILQVWMGGSLFVRTDLLAILAVGHLAQLSQRGAYQMLLGMGHHGRPALAQFIAALVAIFLAVVLLNWSNFGMIGAAIAIVLPITVAHGLVVAPTACRVIGMHAGRMLWDASLRPLAAAAVFAFILLIWRAQDALGPLATFGLGVTVGSLVYGAICWRIALTPEQRRRLRKVIPRPRRRTTLHATPPTMNATGDINPRKV